MRARLVIVTLLAAIGFFNYHNLISVPVQRACFMLMLLVCAAVGWFQSEIKLRYVNFPRLPWLVLMMSLVISIFMASFYHPQSLIVSAVASSTMVFAYSGFFVLLKLNASPDRLMKYMVWLLLPTVIVYVLNFVTIPNNMFGMPMMEDLSRGVLRVSIPLLQCVILVVFYSINKWQITGRLKWIGIAVFAFMIVVLSLTRQAIAFTAILCFFQILYKLKWYNKIIIGCSIAAVAYFTFINLPMYEDMKDLTEEQIEATESEEREDVRIGAWRYYSYECNDDIATWFFGNGMPAIGKSVWGRRFDAYTEETGYFSVDVSWAGLIFSIGIIGTFAMAVILIMAIFKKKTFKQSYLTYFMIFVFLRGFASGVMIISEEIFITMIALYLIYCKYDEAYVEKNNMKGTLSLETGSARKFIVK